MVGEPQFENGTRPPYVVSQPDGVWWTMCSETLSQALVMAARGFDPTDILAEMAHIGTVIDNTEGQHG